ncbi:hypothetical protein IEQ34_016381 [Dendrobium chrysotoxum]|uniref:Uncharacterized protein n=1 Tax=Dendrobium chrysotoxum TaxID=161865 RepID=A0AAV7GFY3_DENCH|nr:hypothetical protein IEQ34_016381 [Dendrobium chrysotoxum]
MTFELEIFLIHRLPHSTYRRIEKFFEQSLRPPLALLKKTQQRYDGSTNQKSCHGDRSPLIQTSGKMHTSIKCSNVVTCEKEFAAAIANSPRNESGTDEALVTVAIDLSFTVVSGFFDLAACLHVFLLVASGVGFGFSEFLYFHGGSSVIDPGFLNGKDSIRSFRDDLNGVSSSSIFPDLKVTSHRGLPTLWISKEEVLALAAPFEFALVEKFLGM